MSASATASTLFWEGNPKALYEFRDGDKQPVDTYASFEHDSRYSDNIVENAYVDELTNFFGVLKGERKALSGALRRI